MAMFDSIIPDPPIRCRCGAELEDFQTTDTSCTLNAYKEGKCKRREYDIRPAKKSEKDSWGLPIAVYSDKWHWRHHPRFRMINAYTICCSCRRWVTLKFKFDEKGLLLRYRQPHFYLEEADGKKENEDA